MFTNLYKKLPAPLKSFAVTSFALKKHKRKYGKYYKKFFQFLIDSSESEQQSRAQAELEKFLSHVNRKLVSVYGNTTLNRLADIPIIDKNFVLNHYNNILFKDNTYEFVKSSGTSGQPLKVGFTKSAYQREYAFWWYHRNFGGVSKDDKVATIAGHKVIPVQQKDPPFWVKNFIDNQLFFSSYHLSNENLKHYIKKLNEFKPVLIHGYPSSIYLIAKYILENNLKLEFMPKMVITASETTLDFQKEAIELAFGCKNYIWYGNTECCGHITECNYGKLHIQPYHSFVRIINSDSEDAKPGEEGTIVATNYPNYAFPLINYNTGDRVRLSYNDKCKCGQTGQIVDYIIGRVEDYIITPDGRYVGRLDHLFKDAKYVRNAQIVQDDISEIIIRIEKENQYSQSVEDTIYSEARERLGGQININFEYTSEIKKDSNGKFSFIRQNLDLSQFNPQSIG